MFGRFLYNLLFIVRSSFVMSASIQWMGYLLLAATSAAGVSLHVEQRVVEHHRCRQLAFDRRAARTSMPSEMKCRPIDYVCIVLVCCVPISAFDMYFLIDGAVATFPLLSFLFFVSFFVSCVRVRVCVCARRP